MADTPAVPKYGSDEHYSQLSDALLQHLLASLNQPAPAAPTPPQQQGLPPLKAAAAALNPQFAPLLLQQQNAPAQAQYQQQQQAFEAAMQGRKEALGAGVQLAGQGSKEEIARLADQIRQQNESRERAESDARNAETARHNKEMENIGRDRATSGGGKKAEFTDSQGLVWLRDSTGNLTPQMDPTTGQQSRKYNASMADTAGRIQEARYQLNLMQNHFNDAVKRGRGVSGMTAGAIAQHPSIAPVAGWMGQGGQDARVHESYRHSLAVTLAPLLSGSKRGMQAVLTAAQDILPSFVENPDTAGALYGNVSDLIDLAGSMPGSTPEQRAAQRSILRGKIMNMTDDPVKRANLQGAFSQADAALDQGEIPSLQSVHSGGGQFSGKTLPRATYLQLKTSEQQRWTAGGGTVGQ